MALKIDDNLLQEIGLGSLPEAEKARMRQHIYETLEMRVGMRLADQMSNQQLDEFEQFVNAQDDAGAFHWLETNFPNYKDVVNEEFEKLKNEVSQLAPQIMSGPQQPQAASPQAPPAMPPQQPYADPGLTQGQGQFPPQQPPAQPYQQPYPPQAPQQPYGPQQPQQPPYPNQQPPAGPGTQPPQAA
jgi:hypothetical protein